MYYSIKHLTKYRYSTPVYENIMEVFVNPRSDGNQHVMSFELSVIPRAHPNAYVDYLGNTLHSFNVPGHHSLMTITARALVNMHAPTLPLESLSMAAWNEIDGLTADGTHWDFLHPSSLTQPTELLHNLGSHLDVSRRIDPLTLLREITTGIYSTLDYKPKSTQVDSPIDDALASGGGVCQDFSHIMIAMVRELGIPCRYVSGYLAHRRGQDRSAEDATHAWVEALLPGLGWIGFDPTNNLIADDHHIRVAIGRDYNSVPPTRGVFKGDAESELSVAVQVLPVEEPAISTEMVSMPPWMADQKAAEGTSTQSQAQAQQQQQQQQQQP